MNDKLISKSFNSMMIMMIFAGVVAMCGSVIDGVIIGNCLSADSMTAFGYASPVFIFLAAIGGVLSNGGKAQCAILTGKGLYEEARENFSRIFLLTVILGIGITFLCLAAAKPVAVLFGASGAYIPLTVEYIRGLAIGAIPIIMMQVMTGYLGLDGGEIYGFYGAVIMSAVNIFFDLMVGIVWHGGLFEMALATSVSYLAALLVQFLYFRRKDRLFRFVRFKLQPEKSLSLIMAGLPSAVSRICCCSAAVILNHLLTSCAGEMAVSACSVRNTIGNFVDAIFMGVVGTISIFSGMFYGERNKNALRSTFRTACKYAMFLAVGCGGVIFLFAPMLANGILKADKTTLSATAACLRFYAISLPGEIFSQILLYHYLATEKSGLSNLICVLHNLVLVVVPAWILGMTAGLNGIWFSWFLSGILPLPVMYLFLKKYKSKNKWDMWAATDPDLEKEIIGSYEVSVSDDMDMVMETTRQLREFCNAHQLGTGKSFRICLAVEEIAGNIVEHGFTCKKGKHFIDLRLTLEKDGRGCLSLRDNGVKFNPLEYRNKDTQYGLVIIRGISEKIDYHYVASMNCLNVMIR